MNSASWIPRNLIIICFTLCAQSSIDCVCSTTRCILWVTFTSRRKLCRTLRKLSKLSVSRYGVASLTQSSRVRLSSP